MTSHIAAAIASVRARIAAACEAVGRDPASVRLLPVSKTFPAAAVRQAYAAGCRDFAENKVQEVVAKAGQLADLPELRWVMIGHLQSNKAKVVARLASEFHALDSLPLAAELDRRLDQEGRSLDVLIEVNSSGEATKYGLAPADVPAFAAALAAYPRLRPRGLMTLALPSPDRALVAACFDRMRDVHRRLRAEVPGEWDELSMGTSGDFELAIAHGATTVRVGTAIFGSRPPLAAG